MSRAGGASRSRAAAGGACDVNRSMSPQVGRHSSTQWRA
jgi:hypothetical protein